MAVVSPFRLLRALFFAIMTLNLHFTLARPIRRDCTALTSVQTISARQTTTIGNLLSQDMPCIPTTVDTTALQATIASLSNTAPLPSGARIMSFWGSWLGSAIKDAWNKVKKAIISLVVDEIVDWTGVGEWVDLALKGWNIITSADKHKVTATSPDGKTMKEYVIKQPPKIPKEQPCGGTTHRMCP